MPRDYVRTRPSSHQQTPKRENTSGSGVIWLLAGILIGLIIAGVFYVKNHPRLASTPGISLGEGNRVNPAQKIPAKAAVPVKEISPAHLQAQFDFYNVLPSQKVIGPEGDEEDTSVIQPSVPPESTQTTQTPQNSPTDEIPAPEETTSQPSSEETPVPVTPALSKPVLKAPLPLPFKPASYILQAGIFKQYAGADQLKAQLMLLGFDVKVTALQKNGRTLQRVWLGPFHSADEAQSMLAQLKENAFSAKLLKSSL